MKSLNKILTLFLLLAFLSCTDDEIVHPSDDQSGSSFYDGVTVLLEGPNSCTLGDTIELTATINLVTFDSMLSYIQHYEMSEEIRLTYLEAYDSLYENATLDIYFDDLSILYSEPLDTITWSIPLKDAFGHTFTYTSRFIPAAKSDGILYSVISKYYSESESHDYHVIAVN